MIRKLLTANRGEIACRIMRTAKRMGITTVAIYSEADRAAKHVELADESYLVGPPPAAQSYLNIDRVLEVCRRANVDAVHPGYGFLSERPAFAHALRDMGIVFVGPTPEAIAAMGDKITSKQVAAEAGVPVVPGYLGTIATAEDAIQIANDIGYPVMIKASAGGGGKGMRIARSADEVAESVDVSRSEATASFGDGRLFIEKYIVDPRHIEIQVLGDQHGNYIHLGERECSVQRRNQKILEESPSSFVDSDLRESMGNQAIALARAAGYDSAGTVEFIVGQDRSFYFLEMNTRLQVEHPVTEFVTGIDIVEEMIRIASGEPLRYRQDDVELKGWAIESRICAEAPENAFLPSAGQIDIYRPAPEQEGQVRVDDGVREGDTVPALYDSLIAKLITYSETRAAAINLQAEALEEYIVEGIYTNIDFLSDLHRRARWRSGDLSTALISDEYGSNFIQRHCDDDELSIRAAVSAAVHSLSFYVALPDSRPIELAVIFEDRRVDLTVSWTLNGAIVRSSRGEQSIVTSWRLRESIWRGSVDGILTRFKLSSVDNVVTLSREGIRTSLRILTPRQADLTNRFSKSVASKGDGELISPILGVLVRWLVAEGDCFSAGDPLCVLEAMKMEMVLRAERDGTVSQLGVESGQTVDAGTSLMRFT